MKLKSFFFTTHVSLEQKSFNKHVYGRSCEFRTQSLFSRVSTNSTWHTVGTPLLTELDLSQAICTNSIAHYYKQFCQV